jgi:hypothetical protein
MCAAHLGLDQTRQAIDEWWRNQGNKREERYQVRASDLGDDCARRIWYKANGAPKEQFEGRMYRLFDRGHREEDRFIDALKGIGVTVWDEQKALLAFGREFGHIDGLGIGFPESPNKTHLLEFKTYNDKNFKKLLKDGHPPKKHQVQVNVYMGLLGIDRCMYFAINKNDDTIWQARIKFDRDFYEAQMQRAKMIIDAQEPPQRIDDRKEFYICKMCHLNDICHG